MTPVITEQQSALSLLLYWLKAGCSFKFRPTMCFSDCWLAGLLMWQHVSSVVNAAQLLRPWIGSWPGPFCVEFVCCPRVWASPTKKGVFSITSLSLKQGFQECSRSQAGSRTGLCSHIRAQWVEFPHEYNLTRLIFRPVSLFTVFHLHPFQTFLNIPYRTPWSLNSKVCYHLASKVSISGFYLFSNYLACDWTLCFGLTKEHIYTQAPLTPSGQRKILLSSLNPLWLMISGWKLWMGHYYPTLTKCKNLTLTLRLLIKWSRNPVIATLPHISLYSQHSRSL